MTSNCYCGSGKRFDNCCLPYIKGIEKPQTAEALMRSRYSAYAIHDAEYLWQTTAPKQRKYHSKQDMLNWAKSNQWLKLEIISTGQTTVVFKAFYLDASLKTQVHFERSKFIQENGNWYYLDGEYA